MTLLCVPFATLQDVMAKLRSDNMLDMNLEKSRVKELVNILGRVNSNIVWKLVD